MKELSNAEKAAVALEILKAGNKKYINSEKMTGNISPKLRKKTAVDGQFPIAVIVSCSDSRAIPEGIFSVGIGELFTIRSAGNVISNSQLGSIEYACSDLKIPLVIVMGHTHCGAVTAAVKGASGGKYIRYILKEIRSAIGEERTDRKACELNVRNSVNTIKRSLCYEENLGLQSENAGFNNEKAVLQGENAGFNNEKAVLQGENAGINNEKAVLQGENAEYKNENAGLQGENIAIKDHINDYPVVVGAIYDIETGKVDFLESY